MFAAFYQKTRSLSAALRKHIEERAKNGSRLAILFAQIALFIATIFGQKTRLYVEHDSTGFKTGLSYQIIAILVSNSWRLSGVEFIRKPCGYKVNSLANLICLGLAIVLEKFYEKSLSSLGFALSVSVLFLILLVIIRPSTDLGLFGFLIGVIGSVAYNLFGLKFQSWIVVAICFPLLFFRGWLEENWLKVEEDQSRTTDRSTGGRNQICKLQIIEELTVWGFHIFWVYNLFRTNCRIIKGPVKSISCTLSFIIMGMPACLLIFNLWFGVALIPRVCSLFQTEREGSIYSEADPEAHSRPVKNPCTEAGAGSQNNSGAISGFINVGPGSQNNSGAISGSINVGPGSQNSSGAISGSINIAAGADLRKRPVEK